NPSRARSGSKENCPLGPWSRTRPAPAALKTASPPRRTTSALSPFLMVDISPWPHSSPIPPPTMTRGMRSSPAWPKPPGIAPNRYADETLATVLPLDVVGRTVARVSAEEHMANYQAARALLGKGNSERVRERGSSAKKGREEVRGEEGENKKVTSSRLRFSQLSALNSQLFSASSVHNY